MRLLSLLLAALLLPAAALAGENVTDVTLKSIDGTTVSLSDYKGKVILVNFWATWCAPCLKEMPKLAELQAELGPRGFQVISISADDSKDQAKVKATARRMKYTPPVLLDTEAQALEIYNPNKDMPFTFIIGPDWTIAHEKKGFTEGDEEKLRHWVEELLPKG